MPPKHPLSLQLLETSGISSVGNCPQPLPHPHLASKLSENMCLFSARAGVRQLWYSFPVNPSADVFFEP